MNKHDYPKLSHAMLSNFDKTVLDNLPDEVAQIIYDAPVKNGHITVVLPNVGEAFNRDFTADEHQAAKDYLEMQQVWEIRHGLSVHE